MQSSLVLRNRPQVVTGQYAQPYETQVQNLAPDHARPEDGLQTGELTDRPPWPYQLYKILSQTIELTYKAVAAAPYIVFVLVQDGWFAKDIGTTKALAAAHPAFEAMIEQVPVLQNVDFSPLWKPWLGYKEHTSVYCERARIMTSCTVHYSVDMSLVVRYLGGEYTGA